MVLLVLLFLLPGLGWLTWRLWRSSYRRAALRGGAAGLAIAAAGSFAYGGLFGFRFLHGSAPPGLDAGVASVMVYGFLAAPVCLPLGVLAGVAWQRWRQGQRRASSDMNGEKP